MDLCMFFWGDLEERVFHGLFALTRSRPRERDGRCKEGDVHVGQFVVTLRGNEYLIRL